MLFPALIVAATALHARFLNVSNASQIGRKNARITGARQLSEQKGYY